MKRGKMYIDPDDVLTPIRKNNRGISGVDHDMTAVTDILIFGLQLSLDLPRDGEALEPH